MHMETVLLDFFLKQVNHKDKIIKKNFFLIVLQKIYIQIESVATFMVCIHEAMNSAKYKPQNNCRT